MSSADCRAEEGTENHAAGRSRRAAFRLAVEMIGVNKWFGAYHALRDIDLTRRARRANRHLRPVGIGQIDDDPLRQRA